MLTIKGILTRKGKLTIMTIKGKYNTIKEMLTIKRISTIKEILTMKGILTRKGILVSIASDNNKLSIESDHNNHA